MEKQLVMTAGETLVMQMALQCFIEDNTEQAQDNPYGFNKEAIGQLRDMISSAKSALNKITEASGLEPLPTLDSITVADALPFLKPDSDADNNTREVPGTV